VSLIRFYPKSFEFLAFIFLLASLFPDLQAQEAQPGVPANPLEDLTPALRPLVQSAAENSWRMNLQEILIKRAEALSMRYSSIKNTKVSLNANVGWQIQETGGETSEGWKYRFDVNVRKPLYTWGAAEADHQYGLLQVKRVKQDRQLAFLSIYRNVINRFIDYQIYQQRAVVSGLNEEISRDNVELRRAEVERGEYPATQFATIELAYKKEALKHEVNLNTLAKNRDLIREEIGIEEDDPLLMGQGLPAVSSDLEILEARIANYLLSLDEGSLKVLASQYRIDQEKERLKKYEVNQRPKLNGLLRLRRDSENIITGDRQNLEFTEGFAGLEINWNIYDGKNTRAYVMDTLESLRQLDREIEILKDNIEDDLEFFFVDLKIQREQSLLNAQSFSWQEGRYRQMAEDVAAGRSPEKDLKVVKRDLEKARSAMYDSRGIFNDPG